MQEAVFPTSVGSKVHAALKDARKGH